MSAQLSEIQVREFHRRCTVVDTHADTLLRYMDGKRNLGDRRGDGHIDLPRLVEGGVDAQFFACYIEAEYKPDRGLKRALQMIDLFYQQLESNAGRMAHCTTSSQIEEAVKSGKVAAILAIEGGEAIGDDLAALRALQRLGVRSIGLVWNQRNLIADGIGEQRTKGGLTNFGVQVVKEMNRLGIIVDVSHLTDEGFWDVIETSTVPIMATHSNSRAVCYHPRNLADDQIKALAKNGGVMGMNFAPYFVHKEKATVDGILDHIDHIVDLVGPDHVGLGSDFDGIRATPEGLDDVTQTWHITDGLFQRGYSEEDVEKILGKNHLRVIREVMG